MTYFWDFVEFIIMQELKQPDAIMRNYTIECDRTGKRIQPSLRNDFVRLGMHRLGLEVRRGTAHTAWSELLAALRGVNCHVDEVFIMAYIAEFYNWHRIKKGELNTWKKRSAKS